MQLSEREDIGMTLLRIELSEKDLRLLRRSVEGQGGWQNLARELQKQAISYGELRLTDEMIERIIRYHSEYGDGGWQERIGPIVKKLNQKGY